MEKAKWKKKIIKQCQDLGTYQDAYIPAIETLAGILEQRDRTHVEFTKSGGKSVVEYVNKFGAVNMVKCINVLARFRIDTVQLQENDGRNA